MQDPFSFTVSEEGSTLGARVLHTGVVHAMKRISFQFLALWYCTNNLNRTNEQKVQIFHFSRSFFSLFMCFLSCPYPRITYILSITQEVCAEHLCMPTAATGIRKA